MDSFGIFLVSILAGLLGSLLGLGGGIIVTPALTLLFGVDIRYAIGASLISVIATSSGSAIAYLKDGITNVRVGMFLEIATTIGAISGALLASIIDTVYLYFIFSGFLLYSAFNMIKNRKVEINLDSKGDDLSKKLRLNGEYYDKALKKNIKYEAQNTHKGFIMMYIAGISSGLLGIGSGSFKVVAMDTFMKLPLKVSSATSNFMMGVTAAASASIYFFRGDINPVIAGPVAIGVLTGSFIGARVMQRLKSRTLRMIFIPVVVYLAIEMIIKGIGVL